MAVVCLRDVDPRIFQEIRYVGGHNFLARPVNGYRANSCIVTAKAAVTLKSVQFWPAGVARRLCEVCYRPVRHFLNWSKDGIRTASGWGPAIPIAPV